VALKAVNNLNHKSIIPILIGRKEVLQSHYNDLFKGYEVIEKDFDSIDLSPEKKYIYHVPSDFSVPVPGEGSINTGVESKICIDRALELWQHGSIDAMVTGPVHKGFIEKSGTPFTGHTEYIADFINEGKPYMMMFSRDYRVLLATTHLPLDEVCRSISVERLLEVIQEGYESIKSIDGDDVKLAITGLDPHCGDDGAIGSFDMDITAVAVDRARKQGINIEGPFAADTLFIADKWKKFNLVIAHYHDQGLIPFKLLAFENGVNVTLGLSIVRTSVDHGTAYDIAGRNMAGYNSMIEAINVAYRLVTK